MKSRNILTTGLMTFCFVLIIAIPAFARIPDWAIGTFIGRDPNTGSPIILTINSNGSVTADFGVGNFSYGTMNNTTLRMGNDVSRISRTRDGLRSTSRTDGQVLDFVRDNSMDGGGNWNDNDNWNNGNVP